MLYIVCSVYYGNIRKIGGLPISPIVELACAPWNGLEMILRIIALFRSCFMFSFGLKFHLKLHSKLSSL